MTTGHVKVETKTRMWKQRQAEKQIKYNYNRKFKVSELISIILMCKHEIMC